MVYSEPSLAINEVYTQDGAINYFILFVGFRIWQLNQECGLFRWTCIGIGHYIWLYIQAAYCIKEMPQLNTRCWMLESPTVSNFTAGFKKH